MNKIKFLVLACFFTFAISCSQQKKYITYKTKQGESMRDIAKRLDLRTKDLLKLNPDVDKRPKVNTTIIIPNPNINNTKTTTVEKVVIQEDENVTEPVNDIPTEVIEEGGINNSAVIDSTRVVKIVYEYVTHSVEPKETVYAITKKFNISKEKLLELNPEYPELKDNALSIGQVLKVASKEVKTFISLEEDLKNYVTHTVKPKETVYSLTRFYNISKEDLVNLNSNYPEINNNYLNIGQILKIRPIVDKIETDNIKFYQDTIAITKPINISFLLPFKAKSFELISANDIFKTNRLTNMVTDFYMGSEIAIDSIKRQGIDVKVQVFDSGSKGSNIDMILEENKLENSDVVIGPFYSSKADLVANKINAPVVFPHYSSKQNEFTAKQLIKAGPDVNSHINFLSSYLKEIYTNEIIFVVGDGNKKSDEQINNLVINLKKHDSINKVIVLKPKDGYIKKDRFTNEMKPNSHCWLIMTSNDNSTVADALNSMIVLPDDVTAQVFCVKKNKAYNGVDNNKLARVDFTYVTNMFMEDESKETKRFNAKYEDLNNTLPSTYAVKGFDVTYDVLMRMASGKKISETFNEGQSIRIETKFDYSNDSLNTVVNEGLFIVKYNNDLSLKRIR